MSQDKVCDKQLSNSDKSALIFDPAAIEKMKPDEIKSYIIKQLAVEANKKKKKTNLRGCC